MSLSEVKMANYQVNDFTFGYLQLTYGRLSEIIMSRLMEIARLSDLRHIKPYLPTAICFATGFCHNFTWHCVLLNFGVVSRFLFRHLTQRRKSSASTSKRAVLSMPWRRVRLIYHGFEFTNGSVETAYPLWALSGTSPVLLFFFTVLVGLYEEPERPPNAVDYIKR